MDVNKLNRADVKAVDDDAAEILADVIADYEQRTGKTLQPAHIERLIINTFAYREALTRQAFNEAYRQQHPRFATGLMLDICGDDVHTPRLEASAARCTIRFQAVLGGGQRVLIPQGTQVAAGATVFATLEDTELTAARQSADVTAACTQSGAAGNGWAVGQINTLLTVFSDGIDVKAANTTIPSGGAEVESDDAYRERILLAPESFSVAGPVGAYEYFARAVSPTICDVYVDNKKTADGTPVGGQVEVTVLTKNGLPSAELMAQVRAELSGERRRPLCDTVTVAAPTAVDYALDAELVLFTGASADAVLAAARSAWDTHDAARREKLGLDIVPLDIQTVLKVAGVYNVLLKTPALRTVQPNQWARCTSVRLSVRQMREDG